MTPHACTQDPCRHFEDAGVVKIDNRPPMTSTPRTEAGKRLLDDVREVVVYGVTDRIRPGYDLAWHVAKGIAEVEAEAATPPALDRETLREDEQRLVAAHRKVTGRLGTASAATYWTDLAAEYTPLTENPGTPASSCPGPDECPHEVAP